MLGFAALELFFDLALLSLVLAVAWTILFVLKHRKAACVIAAITAIAFGLTLALYLEIWGFTWFG